MALLQANIVEPDYYKVLLEIKVGRRFWQFNPSAENAHAFYVRVVEPLRRFQRRGVVERLQEITATDDRTPIALEINRPGRSYQAKQTVETASPLSPQLSRTRRSAYLEIAQPRTPSRNRERKRLFLTVQTYGEACVAALATARWP